MTSTVVATARHNAVHLHCVVETVDPPRHCDFSLPRAVSLAESFPAALQLAHIPAPVSEWEAATAANAPVDIYAPLCTTGLRHGETIIVRSPSVPEQEPDLTPTEVLVSRPRGPIPAVIAAACCAAGGCAAILSCAAVTTMLGFGAGPGLLIAAAVLLTVRAVAGAFAHDRTPARAAVANLDALLWCAALAASAGALLLSLAGAQSTSLASLMPPAPTLDAGLALLTGGAAVVTVAALGAVTARSSTFTTVQLVAIGGLQLCTGAAAAAPNPWLPTWNSIGVLLPAVGLIVVITAPALSRRIGGLKPPVLLSSVENVEVDVAGTRWDTGCATSSAARAVRVLNSLLVAAAFIIAGGAVALGMAASATAVIILSTIALASVVHTARVHDAMAVGSGLVVTAAAIVGMGVAAWLHPSSYVVMACATIFAGGAATSPLWAYRLADVSPVAAQWLHRCEIVAVAAVFPLCLLQAGVFTALRGL